MVKRKIYKPFTDNKSFFLLGPRGTGKSAWLRHQIKDGIFIDLLDNDTYLRILNKNGKIEHYIPEDFKGWIIIDEVQKIPLILNDVHRLIEEKGTKFILTGSSARNLRKQGVNLLAGRARTYNMYPFIPQELGSKFDLNYSLKYGLLPSVISNKKPSTYLKSYVNIYLKEEVMQEGLTRNLMSFTKFLETASYSQGQVLQKSNIARESGINARTINNYFEILDDLLLSFHIPVFTKRAKRKTIRTPKFFFFDVGIYKALRPKGILDQMEEIDGPALETIFLQVFKAVNHYDEHEYNFYYWRTPGGVEVDFILYGKSGFKAFEIKNSKNIHRFDLKNILEFKKDYPEAEPYCIYMGKDILNIEGVKVLPMDYTLKNADKILENKI